jgi:Zn-dependent protease
MQLVYAVFEFVVFLFSVSCHECAQAWMASRLGDQTARLQGRITLNPMQHIDLIGTLLFPAIMLLGPFFGLGGGIVLGWGKSTPVTLRNFKRITRDDNLTTAAGLAAHLLLALAACVFLVVLNHVVPADGFQGAFRNDFIASSAPQALGELAGLTIEVNLALFFFNLLPIPPLDGSRILRNMLPYNSLETFDQIARFSAILIFILGRYWVGFFLGLTLPIVSAVLSRLF